MKKWNTFCISILLLKLVSFTLCQSLFDNLESNPSNPQVPQDQASQITPQQILQPKTTTSITDNSTPQQSAALDSNPEQDQVKIFVFLN